jgi:hypothetical protein
MFASYWHMVAPGLYGKLYLSMATYQCKLTIMQSLECVYGVNTPLGLGYSRKLCNHRYAIALFVTAYNFCKIHSTLGTTPAHGLRLTSEPWTIEQLVEESTATK